MKMKKIEKKEITKMKSTINKAIYLVAAGLLLLGPVGAYAGYVSSVPTGFEPVIDTMTIPGAPVLADVPVLDDDLAGAIDEEAGRAQPIFQGAELVASSQGQTSVEFYTFNEDSQFTAEEKALVMYRIMKNNGTIVTSDNLQ
jgi:hypothetical protein